MISAWIEAVRPKTLIAGIAPVALGLAVVQYHTAIDVPAAILTMLCAVLIQISSNFINEIEDAKRGADTTDRLGPQRAVALGLIPARSMTVAAGIVILAAFLLGLPLVARAGWEVLGIGVVCLVMSWMYTGGPFPLAYKGLGDVFAFLFFGVIAVTGTVFVQTSAWSAEALVVSLMPGLFAANILGVNNLRDIPTDARVGKRTIAVRIGARGARVMYTIATAVAVVVLPLVWATMRGTWLLLPLIAAPVAALVCKGVWTKEGRALNASLAQTAMLYMITMVLTVVGYVITARG